MQAVLVGMHQPGQLFDQRGADGIGALDRFAPVDARLQGHLAGAGQEVVVADRVDGGAGGIAQRLAG